VLRAGVIVLDASDKFPSVDPLLLVSVGIVDSEFNPALVSRTGARGLYQIHSTTGRLLARSLGWEYSDDMLHDPAKNTEMAACYLDLLQTAYNDVAMVLAEYNGGPLNAGYFRANVRALATETKGYVPRVLSVYERLARELGDQRGTVPFLDPLVGGRNRPAHARCDPGPGGRGRRVTAPVSSFCRKTPARMAKLPAERWEIALQQVLALAAMAPKLLCID